jgi:hypothetical protein
MRLIRSHRRRAQGEFGGKLTPSALAADGKRHADRVVEFKRLSRLNENAGNIDQGIWEMVS